jgi:hypothetical protein
MRSKYLSPECNLIEIEVKRTILTGSNEGGGGNENYGPGNFFFENPGEGFPNPFEEFNNFI